MDSDPPPLLFPLPEGQLEQNLVVCKYVTNCLQNPNKTDDCTTGPLQKRHSLFLGQSPTFSQLFIFRGITLKFGAGVNSEMPIPYFMSILSNNLNEKLIKYMGFYLIVYSFYSTSVQQKCCHK